MWSSHKPATQSVSFFSCLQLVAVTSNNTGLEGKSVSLVYLWDVKRQGPAGASPWMTEG